MNKYASHDYILLFLYNIAESNNLVGELPNELWALPELREINLFANSISGPIPGNALNFLSKLETYYFIARFGLNYTHIF